MRMQDRRTIFVSLQISRSRYTHVMSHTGYIDDAKQSEFKHSHAAVQTATEASLENALPRCGAAATCQQCPELT